MRWMDIERQVKVAIGVGLALLIACDPIPDDTSEAGADATATGATGSAASGLVPIGAQGLCTRLMGECAQTNFSSDSDCLNNYLALRVTAACATGVTTAACTDLIDPSSGISQTCFPSCTTASQVATCHADGSLTFCTTAGTTHTNDCAQSCITDGYTAWTGSCGTTFDGQIADASQCWCR